METAEKITVRLVEVTLRLMIGTLGLWGGVGLLSNAHSGVPELSLVGALGIVFAVRALTWAATDPKGDK